MVTLDGISDVASIALDGGVFMDTDTSNNTWDGSGK